MNNPRSMHAFRCESCRASFTLELSAQEAADFTDARAYGGIGLNCEKCEADFARFLTESTALPLWAHPELH